MKNNLLLKGTLLLVMALCSTVAMAQWGDGDDDWGWGDDTEEGTEGDSTSTDSSGGDSGDYMESMDGWDNGGTDTEYDNKRYQFKRPAYERISMPWDSIREMIYYTEVIEEEECEECMADSLYYRSMNYLNGLYGKKDLKKFINEDKKMQKLVLVITKPMMVRTNKFAKMQSGQYEYKLILRFQDFRYKYDVSNFVHLTPPIGAQKDVQRTYMEYYVKSDKNIEANDKILRSVDSDVKEFVEGLKKALKDPPFLGIDLDNDW